MIPTLEVGDHIFVSKFAYGLGIPFTNMKIFELKQPNRGDVIVFKYPMDPSIDYIKRVVGLPGDVVEVRQNEVFINSRPMPRERVPVPCHYSESYHRVVPTSTTARSGRRRWATKQHEAIQEPGPRPRLQPHRGARRATCSSWATTATTPRTRASGAPSSTISIKGKALVVWWSRAPTDGWNIVNWFKSIRWNRFFKVVR